MTTEKEIVGGKYELTRLIGRGGMGSVWEGRHISLGSRVAIKFIEAAYAKSEEARSRFDREAHAAASIQSKHAIQIYDHGVTEAGQPYIVMELLVGETLASRLENGGRLSLDETARILRQIGRALSRAHEAGIVHRDLKPENIFLVRDPENPDEAEVAKVLDFGIAKVQPGVVSGGLAATSSSTRTGCVIGTPHYMSPEQARGLRTVDHRTDVWALGAIAYRCVTGQLAFDGETVGDLLVKVCTDPLPMPSRLVRELPPAFDAWFTRALERDVEARIPTVKALCELLDLIAPPLQNIPTPPLSFVHAPLADIPTMAAHAGKANGALASQPLSSLPTQPPQSPVTPQPASTCSPFTANVAGVEGLMPEGNLPLPIVKPRSILLKAGLALAPVVLVLGIVIGVRHRAQPETPATSASAPPPATAVLPRATSPSASVPPGAPAATMRAPERPTKRGGRRPFDPRDPGY